MESGTCLELGACSLVYTFIYSCVLLYRCVLVYGYVFVYGNVSSYKTVLSYKKVLVQWDVFVYGFTLVCNRLCQFGRATICVGPQFGCRLYSTRLRHTTYDTVATDCRRRSLMHNMSTTVAIRASNWCTKTLDTAIGRIFTRWLTPVWHTIYTADIWRCLCVCGIAMLHSPICSTRTAIIGWLATQ